MAPILVPAPGMEPHITAWSLAQPAAVSDRGN